MKIYKCKHNNMHYRMIKEYKGSVYVFHECDCNGVDIIEKRAWSVHPQKQIAIFLGLSKLELIKQLKLELK